MLMAKNDQLLQDSADKENTIATLLEQLTQSKAECVNSTHTLQSMFYSLQRNATDLAEQNYRLKEGVALRNKKLASIAKTLEYEKNDCNEKITVLETIVAQAQRNTTAYIRR